MSTQDRIWAALGAPGTRHDESAIIAASGVQRATVRRYLRLWELAGHLKVHREGRTGRAGRPVRIIEKLRDGPRAASICFDGSTAYINHPDDPWCFTTVTRYGRDAHVERHRRHGAPAPISSTELRRRTARSADAIADSSGRGA